MMGYVGLLLLLLPVSLAAQGLERELRSAESYLDAGDPIRAGAAYEAVLSDALPSWQRAILHYDIGTANLAAGQWQKALAAFNASASAAEGMPLLNQRLSFNRALSRLMMAREQMRTVLQENAVSNAGYQKAIALFRQTMRDLDTAASAWCGLAEASGASACEKSARLEAVRASTEMSYKELLDHYASLHFPGNPFADALQQLALAYAYALAEEPLTKTSLDKIAAQQMAFGKLIDTHDEESQRSFKLSEEALKQSRKALDASQVVNARLFTEAANFYIGAIAREPGLLTPARILSHAIEHEEFALLLVALFRQLKMSPEKDGAVAGLFVNVQKQALAEAGRFLPAVHAKQTTGFAMGGVESCQCHPWDAVIPLFGDGWDDAKRAAAAFDAEGLQRISQPARAVEQAVASWKQALEALQGASIEKKPELPREQKASNAEANAEAAETLKAIQEMESDDRSGQKSLAPAGASDGRPW